MKINKPLVGLVAELSGALLAGAVAARASRPAVKEALTLKGKKEKISSEDISTDEIKDAI